MIYYQQGNAIVRDAVDADVDSLKNCLRDSDAQEIWSFSRSTPEQALRESLKSSVICITIELDNQPVAMAGVSPDTLLGESAKLWFLSSGKLDVVAKAFAKHSREFVRFALSNYPFLYNFVDMRNVSAIKWIKWLGAEMGTVVKINNIDFQYFTICR